MSEEYKAVTSESERQEVFQYLLANRYPVMGLAADNTVFRLKALRLEKDVLYLELDGEPSRALLASEALALIFGATTGQYILRGKLAMRATNLYAVKITGEMQRMQRRSSFRAVVTTQFPVVFEAKSPPLLAKPHKFKVYDISAGGMGLQIPANLPLLHAGLSLDGILKVPGEADLAIHGEIRHVYPPEANGAYKAGLQFATLSHADQQFLFSLSLKIHRQTATHFLR
jgi:hypothetical protein